MRIGYPVASTNTSRICLVRRVRKPIAGMGCSIKLRQNARFNFFPWGRSQQGKEPVETVIPRRECTRARGDAGILLRLERQMRWNKVAELVQKRDISRGRLELCFVINAPPGGGGQIRRPTLF